ncbi:tyrosine recombinase [Bacteroidia bacterium]|nr:tyrosine recombinase [Bacteroidia bacterium]
MKQEVKVSFYLKKNKMKEDGKCPVMARLTVGKSETAFSAKMTVPVSLWASGRATGKSHTATGINSRLDAYRASALTHYSELYAVRIKVTAEDVKNALLGMASGQETFISYFRKHNENFDKRVGVNRSPEAAYSYWYALGHLEKFLQKKYKLSDIPFKALDKSFIEGFDFHLRIESGYKPGTIIEIMTRLRIIINYVICEGIITCDPFAGYSPERPNPVQKYLTRGELDKLMTTPLTNPNHYLIRDLFLFSCYTGMAYSDMRKLTDEDLTVAEDGTVWIRTTRKKTGNSCEIPLMELPLQILERYRGTASKGRLLPMFSNSTMNSGVKAIAQTCGIERWEQMIFHMGRHTYASEITLSQGVPIETVSRMLGHSRITTTQIYAKITNAKIDEDMKALDGRLAGKFQFAG